MERLPGATWRSFQSLRALGSVWIPHRDSVWAGGRFAESLETRGFTLPHPKPLSRAAGGPGNPSAQRFSAFYVNG